MKSFILTFLKYSAFLGILWGSALGGAYLYSYYIESRLFVWEAKRIWSPQKFEATQFRKASLDDRFAMAANLIEQKYGIGWHKDKILDSLGQSDKPVHFFSRWYYQEGSGYGVGYKLQNINNPWYLAFYHDKKNIITHIKIERNYTADNMLYARIALKLRSPPFLIVFAVVSSFNKLFEELEVDF